MTSIGSAAFYGCSILTEENYIQYLGTWAVGISDREQTSYSLRANTTGLANYLFRNCSSLTSIIIPNSVAYIGNDIFNGCTELETVIDFSNLWISNPAYEVINVDGQIGDFIFEKRSDNTYYLEAYIGNENNLTLPEKYKGGDYAIGGDCFYKNDCLKTLSIPNTVTSIEYRAFYGCTGLTSITIGNSVTSIENEAFYGCTNLTSITIPNSVTDLGWGVFEGCTNLINVTIGNSVTSIGSFKGCTNLTNVVLGFSIDYIASNTFTDCNKLESIMLGSPIPPTVYEDNFNNYHYLYTTLYVPKGSLAAYQAADVWKNFLYIEEYDVRGIEDVLLDVPSTTPIYNLQGVQMKNVENLPSGIYIQGGKKFVVN